MAEIMAGGLAGGTAEIRVQVCYPSTPQPLLRALALAGGSALQASGLIAPDVDLATCPVGVFGKKKPLETVLRDGDRVEIYRPLVADPKDARRRRVTKKAAG
jgi:putative ubiquitin-RnfH superfamily antitoxin RatB of RatAB toxin-antitoxin module